jgi:hypothetical protein
LSGRGKRHHKEKEAVPGLNSSDGLRDQTKKSKRKKGDRGWLVRKKQNTEIQEMDKCSMPFIEWRRSQPSALQSEHSTMRVKPYPTPVFENTVFGNDLADYSSPSVTPPDTTTEGERSPWSQFGLSSYWSSITPDTETFPIKSTTGLLRDGLLLGAEEQSETPYRVERKQRSTPPKEMVEAIKYSPPPSSKLSTASASGNSPRGKQDHITREQLATFTDPIISLTSILLSSASPPAGDYNHDAGCPMARDLTHTGTSPSSSTMFCQSENCFSTSDGCQCSLEVDYNMNGLSEETQWTELPVNSKELTDITIVDLTEDRPLAYDDLLYQYTTMSSSTCPSIRRASDDDNKGPSGLVSGKSSLPPEIETPPSNMIDCNWAKLDENAQIKPRKSVIRLRLNPPKPPMPKILLRVKQPEQVSSQKHCGTVGKNNRRVRSLAPTTKKPRRKRRSQY